jgi:hypothetical protein
MKSGTIINLILFLALSQLFSCKKNDFEYIETSHIIINNTTVHIDSIIHWHPCRGGPLPRRVMLYDIKPQDTSEIYTLINACKESAFDIYIDSTHYYGDFTWSLYIDPVDDLLQKGCYIFYIISLDTTSKYASVASRFDRNCNFIK